VLDLMDPIGTGRRRSAVEGRQGWTKPEGRVRTNIPAFIAAAGPGCESKTKTPRRCRAREGSSV
jgi:hypothetical protein